MVTQLHNANGHRRRELVKRVKAEESTCALCERPLDKTLTMDWGKHSKRCTKSDCRGCIPHPRRVEVDEDIPRSRGGSPYSRANTHAMCRECNAFKSNMTLAEARAKLLSTSGQTRPPGILASSIW